MADTRKRVKAGPCEGIGRTVAEARKDGQTRLLAFAEMAAQGPCIVTSFDGKTQRVVSPTPAGWLTATYENGRLRSGSTYSCEDHTADGREKCVSSAIFGLAQMAYQPGFSAYQALHGLPSVMMTQADLEAFHRWVDWQARHEAAADVLGRTHSELHRIASEARDDSEARSLAFSVQDSERNANV